MDMHCQEIQDNLSAYLDGELPPEAAREVERHLEECAVCRDLLNELRSVAHVLGGLPHASAPRGLTEELQGQIERRLLLAETGEDRETAGSADRALARERPPRWPRVAAIAACLFLAAGVAVLLQAPLGITQKNHGSSDRVVMSDESDKQIAKDNAFGWDNYTDGRDKAPAARAGQSEDEQNGSRKPLGLAEENAENRTVQDRSSVHGDGDAKLEAGRAQAALDGTTGSPDYYKSGSLPGGRPEGLLTDQLYRVAEADGRGQSGGGGGGGTPTGVSEKRWAGKSFGSGGKGGSLGLTLTAGDANTNTLVIETSGDVAEAEAALGKLLADNGLTLAVQSDADTSPDYEAQDRSTVTADAKAAGRGGAASTEGGQGLKAQTGEVLQKSTVVLYAGPVSVEKATQLAYDVAGNPSFRVSEQSRGLFVKTPQVQRLRLALDRDAVAHATGPGVANKPALSDGRLPDATAREGGARTGADFQYASEGTANAAKTADKEDKQLDVAAEITKATPADAGGAAAAPAKAATAEGEKGAGDRAKTQEDKAKAEAAKAERDDLLVTPRVAAADVPLPSRTASSPASEAPPPAAPTGDQVSQQNEAATPSPPAGDAPPRAEKAVELAIEQALKSEVADVDAQKKAREAAGTQVRAPAPAETPSPEPKATAQANSGTAAQADVHESKARDASGQTKIAETSPAPAERVKAVSVTPAATAAPAAAPVAPGGGAGPAEAKDQTHNGRGLATGGEVKTDAKSYEEHPPSDETAKALRRQGEPPAPAAQPAVPAEQANATYIIVQLVVRPAGSARASAITMKRNLTEQAVDSTATPNEAEKNAATMASPPTTEPAANK